MLLAFANFGRERMSRNKPSGCAGKFLVGALCAQKPKAKSQKPKKKQKPKRKRKNQNSKFFRLQAAKNDSGCCGYSRPIRSSPLMKKAGSHARRDAGQGSWYRMYLTIRGRQRIFSARQRPAGVTAAGWPEGRAKRVTAGTRAREVGKEILLLTSGRRGGAPHKLPRSGSLNSGCKPQKPSRSDGQGQRAALDSRA